MRDTGPAGAMLRFLTWLLTVAPLPPPQDKETQHRVIVGRDYYEPQGIEPQVKRRGG